MINHIRTLLLNKSVSASDPGFDDYIPVGFAPVRVPADMFELRDALQLNDANLPRLKHTVNGLMRLLHAPDMLKYTLRFDARTTYRLAQSQYAAPAEFTFDARAMLERLLQLDNAGQASARLFLAWLDYSEELPELLAIWRTSQDYHVRLAAAAAGYAFQVERVRLGRMPVARETTLRRYP